MRRRRTIILVLATAGSLSAVAVVRTRAEDLPPGIKAGSKPGEFVAEKDGAAMVLVPAGAFTMGVAATSSTDDPEAMPAHEEKTGAYYIDVLEVSNARYAKFLAAIATDGHKTCPKDEPANKDHKPLDWGTPDYADRSPGGDYPVCGVDWFDARAYAAWAGKRLPTEAEWEKAARGTDARTFPWGNTTPRKRGKYGTASPDELGIMRANWLDDADGYVFAAPGGKFPEGKSPYGCLDMAGNVWEWTESNFSLYPGTFDHLKEKYPPEECAKRRVYRGGSFDAGTMDLQAHHRHWIEPLERQRDFGLRCVVTAR